MLTAASTDYVQATIELFGAVITIVIGIMLFIITGNKKRSEKNLFVLILLAGVSLIVDAGWYIFDGNVFSSAIIINRICNGAIFLINPLMISFLCGYLRCIIQENNGKAPRGILIGVYSLASVAAAGVILNIFVRWMYDFDSHNIYYRIDNGWFLYAVINCIAILLLIIMVLMNIMKLPRRQRVGLCVFLLAPFVGIALQAVIIGISFIQIGIAVGCVAILVNYVVDMLASEKDKFGITEEKKNFLLIECILMIMILCISASVISCIVSVNLVSNESSEQNSTALTYMVSDVVNSHLSEPVNVSRTMAQSQVVIDALSTDNLEGTDLEARMISYMNRIKNEYGFETIFVASESTHAYYTSDGFSRIMDISRDSEDAWYGEFRNRHVPYSLNIDSDKDNDMALCIFVNVAVKDDSGSEIGVCGVAMSIEDFVNVISEYEDTYNIDIALINKDGLTQFDTDRSLIENGYINIATLQPGSSYEIYYERNSLQAVMSKYMEDLNWYLIVSDNNPDKLNVIQIVMPAIIIFILGISLLVVFMVLFNTHNKRNINDLKNSRRLSETDGLTGLLNRYSLEEFEEEIQKKGMPKPLTVAMVDINGLKFVNDNLGHNAGDELIKGAADCMTQVFKPEGMLYRFGGDEFVVVLRCTSGPAKDYMDQLKIVSESWYGTLVDELSVSIGYVSTDTHPDLSFEELKEEADKLMYQDKDAYYSANGKKRRSV